MLSKYQGRDVSVVQVLPSEGWSAVYYLKRESLSEEPMYSRPIICWALVHADMGKPTIVGVAMDGTGEAQFVDKNQSNYLGLLMPGEQIDKYRKSAHDFMVRREEEEKEIRKGTRHG